jgi:ATP-dependent Lon protease
MQGRVHLGGALSGRDIEAVNKTVSGLMKLLFPNSDSPVPDADLEWIVRLTSPQPLDCRLIRASREKELPN